MARGLQSFIIRHLIPIVRVEYLMEFEDFLLAHIKRMEPCKREKQGHHEEWEKHYKGELKKRLLKAVNGEYGTADVAPVNTALELIKICGTTKATDDLRTYAAKTEKEVPREYNGSLELAMLHFLAGHRALLEQIRTLHEIKRSKSYRVLPAEDDVLRFPLLSDTERDNKRKYEKQQLAKILENKGMTSVCEITCEQYGNDYWFTIERGAYQETEDEVDIEKKGFVQHSSNKGKRDIIVYQRNSDCLYIKIDSDSKMNWLVRQYAATVGNILFGVSRWLDRNRYTMAPFKTYSIIDLEKSHGVDGILSVTIFKLCMTKKLSSRRKREKELLTRGFAGLPTRSVSTLVGEKESVVPEHFDVDRAFFYFQFACHDSLIIPLAADAAPLQLDNDAYKIVARYFEVCGFDIIYNRKRKKA